MKHLSDEHIQALDTCIEKCEEYIDLCGTLSESCSPGRRKECSTRLDVFFEKSDQCIQACRACIKQCQEHMPSCKEPRCQESCQRCIDACLECIRKFTALLEKINAGDIGQPALMDECTAACNQCADACNDMIRINTLLENGQR